MPASKKNDNNDEVVRLSISRGANGLLKQKINQIKINIRYLNFLRFCQFLLTIHLKFE